MLVIDDSGALTSLFTRLLSGAGYTVDSASSAEAGLEAVQRDAPDLVVLDILMPVVDGIGFPYRLRALPGHLDTPVLVVTGAALDEKTTEEIHDLGAAVRYKPVERADLLGGVEAMVSESKSRP